MWEVLKRIPRGRISLRNLPLLVTGLFVAVFLNAGLSNTAFADDVYRTTDGFTYQNQVFSTQVTIKPGDPRGLATAATGEVTAYESINDAKTKASYLYFGKGVDPKTAATGLYTTFDYTPPSTYSNQSPSPPQTLTISDSAPIASNANAGSCTIPGLGWILCPIGDFLSSGVDGIYKIIMVFLDVKPMLQGGPIYDVWNALRSLANIIFVIVFLIVIFSQITSLGISAYGIRKILPRLVIAAILVNISFIICALAIDLSNLLGHAIYAYVYSFYETMSSSMASGLDTSWSNITTAIFAGGGATAAGWLWFSAATAGGLGAMSFALLGILIAVGLAALTALLILFARQGLLIIFTLVSPFAFVAMVLPSTEKWYKKWQEAFLALLLMFPIFSFVFAGALLAGGAIIIGSGGNILLVILGKAVQVLPLAITPLIVRFSTGVLGTIAQFANNRNKGLVDRAKNWTSGQSEHYRKKSLGSGRKYNPWRGTARFFDNIDRRQKLEQQGFEDASQARVQSTLRYRRAYHYANEQKMHSDTAENRLKAGWDEARRTGRDWNGSTNHSLVASEIVNRTSAVQAKEQAERLEEMHATIAAEGANSHHIQSLNIGDADLRTSMLNNAASIRNSTDEIAFTSMAKRLAEAQQKSNVTERLTADQALRDQIGRIRGAEGAQLVHAIAIADERKQYGEFVSARQEIMKHFKVSSAEISQLAKGEGSVQKKDSRGHTITFDVNDEYTREAAIERVFEVGAYGDIVEVVESTGVGGANYDYRSTVLDSLIKSGKSKAAPFLNDKAFDIILNGNYGGHATTEEQVVRRIAEGRLTTNDLSTAHANALKMLFASGTNAPVWAGPQGAQQRFFNSVKPAARAQAEYDFHANFATMRQTAIDVLRDPTIRQATSTESVNTIRQYLGISPNERLDLIDWDSDPRFI